VSSTSATLTHPVFPAGEIAAGAVDRSTDPDQRLGETVLVVGALFERPAIVRGRRPQSRLEQVVDRDIGFRDR